MPLTTAALGGLGSLRDPAQPPWLHKHTRSGAARRARRAAPAAVRAQQQQQQPGSSGFRQLFWTVLRQQQSSQVSASPTAAPGVVGYAPRTLAGAASSVLAAQTKLAEAEQKLESALPALNLRPDDPETLAVAASYAAVLSAQGKRAGDAALLRDALRRGVSDRSPASRDGQRTLAALNAAARQLLAQGGAERAESAVRDALSDRRFAADVAPPTLRSIAGRILERAGVAAGWLPRTQAPVVTGAAAAAAAAPQAPPPTSGGVVLTPQFALPPREAPKPAWSGALAPTEEPLLRAALGPAGGADDLNGLAAYIAAKTAAEQAAAEPLYRNALADARARLGARHPTTASFLMGLGTLLRERGQLVEAAELLSEGLELVRELRGEVSLEALVATSLLIKALTARGALDDALPLCRRAAQLSRELLGDLNATTLAALNALALVLYARGTTAEAESVLREATRIKCSLPLGA